jgi:hypothetical protein
MKTKSLSGVKMEGDEGSVTAVFATLGVKDHDGDVIVKGAIEDGAEVRISAFGHASWGGALPVGKGVIAEVGNEAVFTGKFFTDTPEGLSTYRTVKNLGSLAEWSFSLDEVEQEAGEHEGEPVNIIKAIRGQTEVSPVLRGAGIGTRTLAIKSRETKFSDCFESVIADVKALLDRVEEVAVFRTGQGKSRLAEDSVGSLGLLDGELKRLHALLEETQPDDGLAREYARFVQLTQGV